MTDNRYEQFLDEFGARLRQAADISAHEQAWGRRRAILTDTLTLARRCTRVRILTASALCVAAAAVVLLLIAPGGSSPSYLARASAAITSPKPDSILYERWQATFPSEGPGHPSQTFGPDQLWIEGAAPRRYRLIMQPNPESQTPDRIWGQYGGPFGFGGYPYWLKELEAAVAGHPLELGGELENPTEHAQPPRTLTFTPPDTIWSGRFRAPLGAPLPGPSHTINEAVSDPVTALRKAIAEGHAQEDGTSKLDGHTLKRITFNPTPPPPDAPPSTTQATKAEGSYALVDSETFKPVVIEIADSTYRFLTYEYLPANPTNLALTNIKAQHPNANTIPDTPPTTSATTPTTTNAPNTPR